MKFILIKLPDQQQKKTPHFSIHLASEPQTYFWSLLLCKNLFFGGREVTTGNTSAVRRLPYIQSAQSRFCKKGIFLCQKKWTIKSIKFCELSLSTCYPPPPCLPMVETAWWQSLGLTLKYSGDILELWGWSWLNIEALMCQTWCRLGLGCGCLDESAILPHRNLSNTGRLGFEVWHWPRPWCVQQWGLIVSKGLWIILQNSRLFPKQ